MKKITFLILLFMCSLITYAQTKYPYQQKNKEGVIEYVFNYEQANYINNQLDVNILFDSILSSVKISDSINVLIIDKNNTIISKFRMIIDNDIKNIKNKESIIKTLENDIIVYQRQISILQSVIAQKEKKILIYKKIMSFLVPFTVASIVTNIILLK
jgi:hypothetical protein